MPEGLGQMRRPIVTEGRVEGLAGFGVKLPTGHEVKRHMTEIA